MSGATGTGSQDLELDAGDQAPHIEGVSDDIDEEQYFEAGDPVEPEDDDIEPPRRSLKLPIGIAIGIVLALVLGITLVAMNDSDSPTATAEKITIDELSLPPMPAPAATTGSETATVLDLSACTPQQITITADGWLNFDKSCATFGMTP